MVLLIALLYIGTMIYLANLELIHHKKPPLLNVMYIGLTLVLLAWLVNTMWLIILPDHPLSTQITTQPSTTTLLYFAISLCIGIGVMIYLTRSDAPYNWIEHRLRHLSATAFNPKSSIHRLAVVLMVFQTIAIIWTLVMSGGLMGLDFSYDNPLSALADVASSGMIYLVVAVMGVGWMMRRNTREMLQRLALRTPTAHDWRWGIGMAIIAYGFSIVGSGIWMLVVPPELVEQQTIASRQLFDAFSGSLVFGFLLAIMTGISEEILFRGALQPIFGNIITSVFFTILHIQYALTPATLILFIISIGFGLAKRRASTTASIIAHALYNFIPFLLFTLLTNSGIV